MDSDGCLMRREVPIRRFVLGISNPLIHSQNSCYRTLASADTAAQLEKKFLISHLESGKLMSCFDKKKHDLFINYQ